MNTSETDRAGCKAFCGMSYPQIGIGGETETPARTAWRDSPGFLDRADLERNTRQCWCSALCRDRRYPPLPVPAAKRCEVCCKPGPTVAKRVPPLLFYCDPCYLAREAFISGGNTTNVLRDSAIPERLTKAQLASDYYDDCLEEAGR